MNLEELIKIITEEVLKKVENTTSNKKVMVVLNGGTIGLDESIDALKKLKSKGFILKAVISEFAEKILDMNCINEVFEKVYIDHLNTENLEVYSESFDILIGANITLNTLSKVALGICDNMPLRVISQAIMRGTKIVFVKDACDLDNPTRNEVGYINIPEGYKNLYQNYLKTVESFGVEIVNSYDLYNSITGVKKISSKKEVMEVSIEKNIITREDIMKLSNNKEIMVLKSSIVTSLAKDLCEEMGIKLIRR